MFVFALLVISATRLLPALLRVHRTRDGDRAQLFLAFAVRGLPSERTEWARAMLAELAQVRGGRERWQFAVGCGWAAARMRIQSREPAGAVLRISVLAGAAFALALVGYGLVRYPGLRSESNVWGGLAVFVITLCCYAVVALSVSRGAIHGAARRDGLIGGIAVGAGWLIGIAPPSAFKGWVFLPLLVALIGPAAVAALAGRHAHDSRAGSLAALWSGLVGGLIVFIIWVIATYARAGGPYDAGLVRDFHNSGSHDLATYAVSDNLGSALVLLMLIPAVALAFGSLSARLGTRQKI